MEHLKFDMVRPCDNCPFRKDKPFYLRKERKVSIVKGLYKENSSFICHKTVDYDNQPEDSEKYLVQGGEQHCAGALIVMLKEGRLFDTLITRLAVWLNIFDPNKLDLASPTFDSMTEFIEESNE